MFDRIRSALGIKHRRHRVSLVHVRRERETERDREIERERETEIEREI